MTARIILVRHGESKHNLLDLMSGRKTCEGLSDRGRKQAQALAERLLAEGATPDVIISSGVCRADETAAYMSAALGVPVIEMDDFREIDVGDFEGHTWREHRDHIMKAWTSERDLAVAPNGESLNQAYDRVAAAMLRLAREYEGKLVIVATHAFAPGAAIERLLNEPADLEPENASMTEFEYENGRWRMVRFNDRSHF